MSNERAGEIARAALTHAVTAVHGQRRDGQARMVEEVSTALAQGQVLMVQAGTGTGKSLGYLIPAIAWATQQGERVVVSTATLALQRQIMTKDAPTAVEAVAKENSARADVALLKGWQHYLCLHRLHGGYPEPDTLFDDAPATTQIGSMGEQMLRVRQWAEETDTGDRDDLSPGVHDKVWRHVSVTRKECVGSSCPYFTDCWAARARTRASEADVVVTNHTLLGIHAASDVPVLPEFAALIVDEAHELADRVTGAGAQQLSTGVVQRLVRVIAREAPSLDLDEAADALGEAIAALPAERLHALPEAFAQALLLTQAAARDCLQALRAETTAEAGSLAQARAAATELAETCDRFLGRGLTQGEDVAWVERVGETDAVSVKIAPLDVAPLVANQLLEGRGVVLTSATLSVGGSFQPAANRMGAALLGEDTWSGIDVGSPFSYDKQGILYIASDVPAPDRDGISEEALDRFAELVKAAGGQTLGLFSSRRGVERAAERLRVSIDTPVYVQGEDQLSQLVDDFLAEEESTLLGTLTLWQGVDAPGPTCSLVVIDRIPFPRPDDPLVQARSDRVKERGGNPFMAVSLSHAALLMAQGAGRLIRRGDDRGMVAVLDPRLETQRYGSILRSSMPPLWPTNDAAVAVGALRRLAARN